MKRLLTLGAIVLMASPGRAGQPELLPSGADYVHALQVADDFLQAWSNRDSDAGMALVSKRLGSETEESEIRQYLEGLSNPHHVCFEIGAGIKVDSTRFAFPVVFYEYYLGEPGAYRSTGTVDVVRETSDWRVDSLPPEGR